MLVGQERNGLVSHLTEVFNEIKSGGTSQLVVLSALPGWGKTRIVQELYSALAVQQTAPRYWPPSVVVEEEGERGVRQSRGRVWPEHMVDVAPGAHPDFMWWGISCDYGAGRQGAIDTLDEASRQIADHALGRQSLEELKSDLFGGGAIDLSTNLLSVLSLVGLLALPPVGAAVTIVAGAKFLWDKRESYDRAKAALAERKRKGHPLHPATSRDEADEASTRFLIRWSAKLPMVIVLDNAQWATPRTLGLLNHLLTSNESRVLIVATTWPHGVRATEDFSQPDHAFREQLADWRHRLSDRVEVKALEPMSSSDMSTLFDTELAGVPQATKSLILDRVGNNPLLLRLYLRKSGSAILRGKFRAQDIPTTLRQAFEQIWEELPSEVRGFLALAAHFGRKYFVDLLDGVSHASLGHGARTLADASVSLELVRGLSDAIQDFGELTLYEVTVTSEEYGQSFEGHQELRASLEAFTRSDAFDSLSSEVKKVLLGQQVHLASEFDDLDPTKAAQAALDLAIILNSSYNYAEAVITLRQGLGLVEIMSEVGLLIRGSLAATLLELDRLQEALELERQLFDDYLRILGSDHPDTLRGRNNLAKILNGLGQLNEALELQRQLLDDRLRILGPDHPATLDSRYDLAFTLYELDRLDEAELKFAALLPDCQRVLGSDYPLTTHVLEALKYLHG